MTPSWGALIASSHWHRVLGFSLLGTLTATVFLVVGKFGSWYDSYTRLENRLDPDGTNRVVPVTRDLYDADGLFTDAGLAAPLALAILCLVVSTVFMIGVLQRPSEPVAPRLRRAAAAAGLSAAIVGGSGLFWVASMSETADWWLAEAFWGGLSASLCAAVALAYLSTRTAPGAAPAA